MNTELLPADGLILCAVSGGADSMYLLCRLHELGCRVAAAHFNHQLRGAEADRDEFFVRDFCVAHEIPFLAGRGDVAAERRGGESMEEAARRLRYDFLEFAADSMGAEVIATAHNADDNAETVLLNLTRGTGLAGLCGIPPRRGRLIRPMLDTTREQVLQWLKDNDIPHIEDSTNAGDDYARNRLRHRVMPVLRGENPRFSDAVGRMTAHVRQDEDCLTSMADDFVRKYSHENILPAEELLALHPAVSARVLRAMAGVQLSAERTDTLMKLLHTGGSADLPGMTVTVSCGRILFGDPPFTKPADETVIPGTETILSGAGLCIRCREIPECPDFVYSQFTNFYLRYEKINGKIIVGSRRSGDAVRPVNRGCTKSVRRLFLDAGIPVWQRDAVPVLRDEQGVLGVYGLAADERAAAVPGDRNILHIQFYRPGPEKEAQGFAP